jgi:phage terminase small subunit
VLTPKQQRFVDEYLVDLNGSAAARRAGYSERTANRMASENLSKPDLAAAIFARRAALAEQTGRSVAAVMADIGRVRDDAMQVITDPDTGAQVMLSHKDALKALELEGKHLGAFTEKLQVTGPGGGPIQSVSLTPAEFARIAAEVAGRI